jgi:15-hydroxyprostaglandin dehydrogenase (NAD)
MDDPVAVVTGACSGIGLALTHHLLAKQWRVVMADIAASRGHELAAEFGPKVLFVDTDVSSWDAQASLFKRAYDWGGGRLDFFAANAGLAGQERLFNTKSNKDEPPTKPSLLPIEVMTNGTIYGIQLYAYYVSKSGKAGKVVITASVAGSFPLNIAPLYTAAKHSVSDLRFLPSILNCSRSLAHWPYSFTRPVIQGKS